MSGLLRLLCVALLGWTLNGPARAGGPAPASAVHLAHSAQFTLHSQETGRDYLIQVAVPSSPAPAKGYAVLYVLDGNLYWPLLRLAHQMFGRQGPYATPRPLLIVGIGYPGVDRFAFDARADDYTPPGREAAPPRAARDHGGAPAFLAFIRDKLQPAIRQRYRVNPDQRALLGHSFGGLFAVYTLLAQPDTFDHYLAISPSLWWDRHYLEHYRSDSPGAPTPDAGSCVLIGVGEREKLRRTASKKREREITMADLDRQLVTRLRDIYPGLDARLVVFPGERHGTVMWPAARKALAFLRACSSRTTGNGEDHSG